MHIHAYNTNTLFSFQYKIYICNYPFVFDAEAKTTLLQLDQNIQVCKKETVCE